MVMGEGGRNSLALGTDMGKRLSVRSWRAWAPARRTFAHQRVILGAAEADLTAFPAQVPPLSNKEGQPQLCAS